MINDFDMLPWWEKLKLLRIKEKLTQIQLAERIGVSTKTYIRWEKGTNVPMQIYKAAVGNVLKVDAKELFGRNTQRKEEEQDELCKS